ncbi:Ecto-ADP-ribosyltransferase 5-like Protein [Tribolium castaneum]|uniref:NAD(P)(+)--arginine ADP-ribosyltransferase n=1 Tax=Tribolium castaneum TaxID=7070 RepID=D6WII6_TRICA|nr:Ecto-ADP-ribosyltransferase 5-like Protein [Tribolium castaneum]
MSKKGAFDHLKRFVGTEAPIILPSVFDTPDSADDFPIAQIALNLSLEKIRLYLNRELAQNPTYYAVWQEATKIFEEDVATGKYEIIAPNEFYQAIISYTYVNGSLYVYSDFNAKSRQLTDIDSWNRFPYKSLYSLLAQSVNYVISMPNAIRDKIQIYRGLDFHFPCEVNQVVNFVQFSSFSCSKEIAEEFSGNGTVFQLRPPMKFGTAIGIQEYSVFYEQEEVLVMPWSVFVVKEVAQVDNRLEVVLENV